MAHARFSLPSDREGLKKKRFKKNLSPLISLSFFVFPEETPHPSRE